MKGVNPGTYVVSATPRVGDNQIGVTTIHVLDVDYPRADVVLGPGVTINARLFDVPAGADLTKMQISLLPLESYLPVPEPSGIQPNAAITIAGVQPGDYVLKVAGLPDTAYVKAARSDQRDVLEQFMQVQYDAQVPLDIQLAFDGVQIAGVVTDAAGQASDHASVVLIPDGNRRHRPDQYRMVTSAADGKFSIGGIPPGEYKLLAWEFIEANAWLNPDFMINYEEFGAAVTLGPNARVSAQIRITPERR